MYYEWILSDAWLLIYVMQLYKFIIPLFNYIQMEDNSYNMYIISNEVEPITDNKQSETHLKWLGANLIY